MGSLPLSNDGNSKNFLILIVRMSLFVVDTHGEFWNKKRLEFILSGSKKQSEKARMRERSRGEEREMGGEEKRKEKREINKANEAKR